MAGSEPTIGPAMSGAAISPRDDLAAMFDGLNPDPSWAFGHLTPAQTSYATHGYHRYPAKFIPQLVARLIAEYSSEGELVVDPFMGSGTTLVEAKLLKRPSVGADINPVAYWVSCAKVNAIEPARLQQATELLSWGLGIGGWDLEIEQDKSSFPFRSTDSCWLQERLSYWFPPTSLAALMRIHKGIDRLAALQGEEIASFFRCALSHCLKPLSWWSDRSVKPTRKLDKRIPDAYRVFFGHVKRMLRGNQEFWQLLSQRGALAIPAQPYCTDARQLPIHDGSASLIVTSPPYVTSYEYADLHQLSALWFGAATTWREFRGSFIGSANGVLHKEAEATIGSALGERIVAAVGERSQRKAKEVARYFAEMRQCFGEMARVLRPGGRVCIVIGNTHLAGVAIQNAQVFAEQLATLGFSAERVILREIPSKILPRTRDRRTGKFTRTADADYIAYPTEYILVFRKP